MTDIAMEAATAAVDELPMLDNIAGVLGNALEWYDFALFGFFSDIIADNFFPPDQEGNNSLVQSFGVFGVAFLMRPVGGFLIGYMGDKHGRKHALSFSLMLMGLPTFIMGCLPTYERIGGWAIVFLILCRMMQGVSVGGQLPASMVYTLEKRPRNTWGYYSSFVGIACGMGTLLGNFVGALLRDVLTDEELHEWGWRIPFLTGILITFVGLYLHYFGMEHHPNKGIFDRQDSIETNPVKVALTRERPLKLIAIILAPMLSASSFYLTFVWMAVLMEDIIDPPIPHAFWINFVAMFFGGTIWSPLSGHLSDRFGRVRMMTIGAIGVAIMGPVTINVIVARPSIAAIFFAQWFLGVTCTIWGGSMFPWLMENFESKVRLTAISIGYDFAHVIAGGFSPAIATILADRVSLTSPGFLYVFFAIVSLIGVYTMTYIQQIENRPEPLISNKRQGSDSSSENGSGSEIDPYWPGVTNPQLLC